MVDETTKLHVKIRGGHRARTTKLSKDLEELLREGNPGKARVQEILEEVIRQRQFILELDAKILPKCIDIDREIQESSEESIKISTTVRSATNWLEDSAEVKKLTKASESVKLPTINLRTFNGNPLEWQCFWDLFKSSVHDRKDLAESAKFYYLSSQLVGDAALLLANFDHTEDSYAEAVDLLQNTFGKKKIIIEARLNALFDLKPPRPTHTELGNFRSQYEGHIRGLKSLGANITEAGYVYAAILLRKLPANVMNNINRASGSDEVWTLDRLRNAIEQEMEYLRAIEEPGRSGCGDRDRTPYGDNFSHGGSGEGGHDRGNLWRYGDSSARETTAYTKGELPSTMSYASNNYSSKPNEKQIRCVFCTGNHSHFNCAKYVSVMSKRERIGELKLCYNCLRNNHQVRDCRVQNSCTKCGRRHHSTICDKNNSAESSVNISLKTGDDTCESSETERSSTLQQTNLSMHSLSGTSILPIASVCLVNELDSVGYQCLFDTGAQRTYILKSIADKLKSRIIRYESLSIEGFNSKTDKMRYPIVEISANTNAGIVVFTAVAISKLPSNLAMPGRKSLLHSLSEKGIPYARSASGDNVSDLGLIIGIDNFFKFVLAEKVGDDVYVIPSILGNLIAGTIQSGANTQTSATTVLNVASCGTSDESDLDCLLTKCWDLDTIGIKASVDHSENFVAEQFESDIVYDNGRYEVSLPWKHEHPKLPSNFSMTFSRLQSTLGKLRSNLTHLNAYDAIIKEQLNSGFIEVVDETSIPSEVHYLSHHAVLKESKTTPLRIVFDCSAKTSASSPSLNDCLYSGPSLLNDLGSVLMRFRLGRHACTADIAKAFLQVGLKEKDRNYTRFLWPENPDDPNSKILTYRFKVVLFGATSSQFLLNATVLHHLSLHSGDASERIRRNIYVDNIQSSFDTETEMIDFYRESRDLMMEAGFPLREWSSTASELNQLALQNGDFSKDAPGNKILGVHWDSNDDIISVKDVASINKAVTKRQILANIAKVYDPLGFCLPVTIRGRLLMQRLWKGNYGWDIELPSEILIEWENLAADLSKLSTIKLSREICIGHEPELHVFADASTLAYGAVAYIVSSESTEMIFAKARVAPIKSITLPQLELMALTLGSRILKYVINTFEYEIPFKKVMMWSDSKIVLSWLETSNKVKPFVSSRVKEIKTNSNSAVIAHVKGCVNPADYLTRGITVSKLLDDLQSNNRVNSSNYFKPDIESIKDSIEAVGCDDCTEPCDAVEESLLLDLDSDVCVNTISLCDDELIVPERYSRLSKLLSTVVAVHRGADAFLRKIGKIVTDGSSNVDRAMHFLLRSCQRTHFHNEYAYLLRHKSSRSERPPNLVRQLGLYMDDQLVIRCRGRLQFSQLSTSYGNPVLLPPKAYLTKLIVLELHETKFHFGVDYVLSHLRAQYWVPSGRQTVKKIIRGCVKCNKIHSRAFQQPPQAPLPKQRVTQSRPFQVTGVDYSGALYVRDGMNRVVKVYIALFTCAVTRAIHLEVVEDCSVDEFLSALRRFVSRKSVPEMIISDNAKTFEAADKTLNCIFSDPEVESYCNTKGIQWKFLIKRAPWTGGFYERLIGITKNALKKVLGNSCVTLRELRTILTETEAAINDRPLTYVTGSLDDLEPLTPSQLISGHKLGSIPPVHSLDIISDPNVNERERISTFSRNVSKRLHDLWNRWYLEYLSGLRECHKNKVNFADNKVCVGEVVLIHDDVVPRMKWRLGLVVELYKGYDGIVRSAKLKTSTGFTNRPVSKLYPLEVRSNDLEFEGCTNVGDDGSRPKRLAAIKALDKIRNLE